MTCVMVPLKESNQRGKPRPAILRALGHDEPPQTVQIVGETYRRLVIFKHDSMAATALYTGPDGRVICKFARQQSAFIFPLAWLGRRIARHEARCLALLADVPHVPRLMGNVCIDGKPQPHVIARQFIQGHPLAKHEQVDDDFFPKLENTLDTIHARKMAYVDLHKRENIIVDEQGQPHLIDFQISFILPRSILGLPLRWLLRVYQLGDQHHLNKHIHRHRPDLLPPGTRDPQKAPPLIISLWRMLVATPFRKVRRTLLVLIGVRKGSGHAVSEHMPEDAVQREMNRTSTTATSDMA